MTPKAQIKYGNEYPFDAPDEWWMETADSNYNPKPRDWAHATARGIIEELKDRETIGPAFGTIDEVARYEIVRKCAAIIREGAKLR